jgi:hypothetical protein
MREEMTMSNQNPTDAFAFQPLPMFAGAMQKSAYAFWKAQKDILDEMQAFAEGWFERRHIGVQAAQEACKRMCEAKTPIEWFQEYQVWANGSFQRLMADGLVVQQTMKNISDEMGPTLVPAINKEQSDATVAAAKTRRRVEV